MKLNLRDSVKFRLLQALLLLGALAAGGLLAVGSAYAAPAPSGQTAGR